jgi:hypothetical protein
MHLIISHAEDDASSVIFCRAVRYEVAKVLNTVLVVRTLTKRGFACEQHGTHLVKSAQEGVLCTEPKVSGRTCRQTNHCMCFQDTVRPSVEEDFKFLLLDC